MNGSSTNIEQLWQQARALLAAGETENAVSPLETAAAASHPAACFNLGCLHIFSLIEKADKASGTSLIEKAAEQGHGGAFYRLAMIELGRPGTEPDWQYANECLRKSAELRHPPALRSLAIHWARASDKSLLALGTQCLEHAARGGDIVSLALLMHRLYEGIGCEKNELRASAIHGLLVQSSLAIDAPAITTDPTFAQNMQLAELPSFEIPRLQDELFQSTLEMLSESPWVCVAENVASQEECRLAQYIGGPHLNPSVAATPDGERLQLKLRSSFDMQFEEMLEDITLLLLQRRMASIVSSTPAYSEYMQLLRYQYGQEYLPHRDYLPRYLYKSLKAGGPGQRESTVIVYLNDVAIGGETEFIELGKKITPKTGRVLAFKNLHADGSPDPRTLHAGLPVTSGSKWIATLWIHQGVFRK